MVDQIYSWLAAFQRFAESGSGLGLVGLLAFLAVLARLSIVFHEAGHALAGKAFGVRARELVAGSGDDPAVRFRLGAMRVRIGAGLQRSSSTAPTGWVRFDAAATASAWKWLVILLAGAAAEVVLAALLLAAMPHAVRSGVRRRS